MFRRAMLCTFGLIATTVLPAADQAYEGSEALRLASQGADSGTSMADASGAQSGSNLTRLAQATGTITQDMKVGKAPQSPGCKEGFVWREARQGDRVCVTENRRNTVRSENKNAARLRSPNGGPYGPDTCIKGYVWREAVKDDHVCVSPQSRQNAAEENRIDVDRRSKR